MSDKDIKKRIEDYKRHKLSESCCCYVVDPCGCYVDPCGCYTDPCGCYVTSCCC
ncbi:MAG: hypothetical protein H8E17_03035 [Deltaproteobacteria bacterium]|nr:hypothetical protein [Deltaproteobacteria bacterium]